MSADGNIWTVPAGVPFVDALAEALLGETAAAIAGGDAMALARYTVLLPTRRACRSLAEAFLRVNRGAPLLLPRLEPLGDVDEEELALADAELGEALAPPPAIGPTRRLLLLSRLVMAFHRTPEGAPPGPDQAAWLACELARLLDQVHTEELDFAGLADLVPERYAAHWQKTLAFLTIVTEHWPRVLEEESAMDPVPRRTALLDARGAAWRARPADPVLVAGSTGSVPASARLIAVVAGLPQGRVVLPGLDRGLDDASWQALDPAHPQYGLKLLLERLGVDRSAVRDWPAPGGRSAAEAAARGTRARLVSEVMRPAATTDAWRAIAVSRREAKAAMRGVERVDCPTPQEEAGVVALALREALETPGKTAALVTLDRGLARRVAAELRRWGVDVDDSAGLPLVATPSGSFLLLTARMAAEAFAPVALLAACKHPLAAAGLPPAAFRARLRRLERAVLRGPRPAPGISGLRQALAGLDERRRRALGDGAGVNDLLARLARSVGSFADLLRGPAAPLADLLRAHLACAEALAESEAEAGAARLWGGDAGEQAARVLAELLQAAADFPAVPGAAYPGLLEALMSGVVVRPRYGRHPRLNIWGPLEARLQQADRIVLGGLNEGSWPREVEADPWMSRPMRERFGLPPAERRIGLSAHDFAQAFCAGEVLLTRAQRVDGTPTVPSRWLLRLETVLQGLGLAPRRRKAEPWTGGAWLAWQRALDAPGRVQPTAPPAPAPPVAVRPRQLSVTQVETWMRDPYAIYARRILRLEALEPLDADPGAADYGTLIHRVLDRFLRACPDGLPDDAVERLLALGREVFRLDDGHPGVAAFWWPRFARVAAWFVETERRRRATLAAVASEVRGRLELAGPEGPFVLTAVADRIDRLADGTVAVIDYKTGGLPTKADVRRGASPQLPLEAAIAASGGFEGLPPAQVAELAFWRVSGGNPPGEVQAVKDDAAELGARARAGLERLVRRFDRPDQPYLAVPRPAWAPRYSDYTHLARTQEWTATGQAEDT